MKPFLLLPPLPPHHALPLMLPFQMLCRILPRKLPFCPPFLLPLPFLIRLPLPLLLSLGTLLRRKKKRDPLIPEGEPLFLLFLPPGKGKGKGKGKRMKGRTMVEWKRSETPWLGPLPSCFGSSIFVSCFTLSGRERNEEKIESLTQPFFSSSFFLSFFLFLSFSFFFFLSSRSLWRRR